MLKLNHGWIQKEPNPTDRRAALLSLTSQGKTFIEEHIRISDEKLLKMMSGISESEAERFNMALKTIIEMLEKTDGETSRYSHTLDSKRPDGPLFLSGS